MGKIEESDGQYLLTFKKITTKEGKELDCVHSGNVNDILLPIKLPNYTILRREIKEALDKKGLSEGSTPMIGHFHTITPLSNTFTQKRRIISTTFKNS